MAQIFVGILPKVAQVHFSIHNEETFLAVAEKKKRRSNIESDKNRIRRKKTRYVAKVDIDEQNNRE